MLKRFKNAKTSIANDEPSNTSTHRKFHISDKTIRFIILPIIAIVAFAITIITIMTTRQPAISEDYFVSDETKTSITLTPSSDNGTGLIQTFLVYTYDGENVSSLKTYFEYPDEETAKTTLESAKDQPEFKGATTEGKYIVVAADESQYKGLTASDVMQQAEALKAYQDSQTAQDEPTNESTETDSEE